MSTRSLATLLVGLVAMAAMATTAESVAARSTPPVSLDFSEPLTGDCAIAARAQDRVGRFSDDVVELIPRLPGVSPEMAALGVEAAARIRELPGPGATALCSVLDSPAGRSLGPAALSESLGARRAADNCLSTASYSALLGLKTIVDIAAELAQAYCDGSACPLPLEPPSCSISCAAPLVLNVVSEFFQLPMDLSNKCSLAKHEDEMGDMREDSGEKLVRARSSALESDALARATRTGSADEASLVETADRVAEAFDGSTRGTGGEGIGPGLDRLEETVALSSAQQVEFERLAIRSRLENALSSGVTYSRMQRPRQYDGLLEEVRELVADRIQAVETSGQDVTAAVAAFRSGDLAFNAGDFRDALNGYREAYAALGTVQRGDAK